MQFLKAPSYLEVIAFIDQTKLNLTPDDFGGELDPHGADLVRILPSHARETNQPYNVR